MPRCHVGGYRPWVFYYPIVIHITPPKKHIKLPVNLHVFMVNWYVNQVTGIRRQIRRLTLFTLAPQICPRDFKCGSNPKCMVFTGKSNSNGLAQWSLDPQPRFITRIFLNWDHSPFWRPGNVCQLWIDFISLIRQMWINLFQATNQPYFDHREPTSRGAQPEFQNHHIFSAFIRPGNGSIRSWSNHPPGAYGIMMI